MTIIRKSNLPAVVEFILSKPDVCELCRRQVPLVIDHEHKAGDASYFSGAVRGWLCKRCNTLLGHLERYSDLETVAQYLLRPSNPDVLFIEVKKIMTSKFYSSGAYIKWRDTVTDQSQLVEDRRKKLVEAESIMNDLLDKELA